MNHLRKFTLVLSVFALLFSISCGSDDEGTTVDLSDVEFAFDTTNPPVDQTVVNNMISSSDQNAQQTGLYLSSANALTAWISLFDQPSGAETSSVPIGTCGGSAVVYSYTANNGSDTFTVAYQICETSSAYTFQVFFSQNGSTPELFIYAEQSKSANQGYMEVYGTAIGVSDVTSQPVLTYTWAENSDGSFNFMVTDASGGFVIDIDVDSNNSGELSYTIDGDLYYEATWNASGTAGTYTYYNTDGSVADSGSWTS